VTTGARLASRSHSPAYDTGPASSVLRLARTVAPYCRMADAMSFLMWLLFMVPDDTEDPRQDLAASFCRRLTAR
jgi:hypothetical protein